MTTPFEKETGRGISEVGVGKKITSGVNIQENMQRFREALEQRSGPKNDVMTEKGGGEQGWKKSRD